MEIRLALAGLAVALAATHITAADDLAPPWWRGLPGSTWQHWDFSAGPGGGPPDAGSFNPYGVPILTPLAHAFWLPVAPPPPGPSPRADVWFINGPAGLFFDVPNSPQPKPQKWIRIQVTFLDVIPDVFILLPGGGGGFLGAPNVTTPLPDPWIHAYWDVVLPFNPPMESILIGAPLGGNIFVDQVVIDTICIPAPGAGIVLGLALCTCTSRRRRSG